MSLELPATQAKTVILVTFIIKQYTNTQHFMIYKKYNNKSFKKGVTKHIIEKVLGISKNSNKNKLFLRVS